jgi:periplasmic divalent cation tolerance protein
MTEALVVLTTVEKTDEGEQLARLIVESELAACVQILPPMTSIYRWEGKLEKASEILLLIKTTRAAYPALEKLIIQNHSYQIPEIISLTVEKGLKDYLDWLTISVRKFE